MTVALRQHHPAYIAHQAKLRFLEGLPYRSPIDAVQAGARTLTDWCKLLDRMRLEAQGYTFDEAGQPVPPSDTGEKSAARRERERESAARTERAMAERWAEHVRPHLDDTPRTINELADLVGRPVPGAAREKTRRKYVRDALSLLVETGEVVCTGKSRSPRNPTRYALAPSGRTETGSAGDGVEHLEAFDDGPACHCCGCTQNNACPEGCEWVQDELEPSQPYCSACREVRAGILEALRLSPGKTVKELVMLAQCHSNVETDEATVEQHLAVLFNHLVVYRQNDRKLGWQWYLMPGRP